MQCPESARFSGRFDSSGRAISEKKFATMTVYGGRSSVGRVPDCDSGCRGFEPRRSPQFQLQVLRGLLAQW